MATEPGPDAPRPNSTAKLALLYALSNGWPIFRSSLRMRTQFLAHGELTMAGEILSDSSFSYPVKAPIDLVDVPAWLYSILNVESASGLARGFRRIGSSLTEAS
jgi:hypothetical protein